MVLPANEVPTNFWLTGANIVLRIVPPPIKTNHAILPIGVEVVSIPYQYLPPNIHNEYQAFHTQWKQKGGKLPDNFTTWDGTQSFK